MSLSASIAEQRDWLRQSSCLHVEGESLQTLVELLTAWQIEARNMEERLRFAPRGGHVAVTAALFERGLIDDPKVVRFPRADGSGGRS